MVENMKHALFKLADGLYHQNFALYRPLYFAYKKMTDRKAIEMLTLHVKNGMTILDIGGNIGFYAMLFSRLSGEDGKVHVFEPDIVNFNHLKSNTCGMENVVANNCAVGESTRTIRLYRSDELNVDHQTYDSGESRPFTEIGCISIDDYFRNGEKVDFIKIDIQGYDFFAVKGMTETLRRSRNVKIFGEFWPYGLQKAGVNPLEYLELLRESGFNIEMHHALKENDYMEKVDEKLFYTNFYGEKS